MSQATQKKHNGTVTQTGGTAGTSDNPTAAVTGGFGRMAAEFFNNHATVTMYVSNQPIYATAVASGRPVTAGASWTDSLSDDTWYVFAASGTLNYRVNEVRSKAGEV